MYPTLFEVFGQPLPAYFSMLVLGFGTAIYLAARQARRMELDHDTIIDLGLFALIWGVVGARILHVIADGYFWDYVHLCTDPSLVEWNITPSECTQAEGIWHADRGICEPSERDCFAWAAFWRGGLAYYGGLLAAGAYGLWFLRREKFPVLKGVDLVGMTIPIGLFFGRMGCFLGGCCFGTEANVDWAVQFPSGTAAYLAQWKRGVLRASEAGWPDASMPVHPTQLYEAFGCLAIAAVGMLVVRPRKRFDGQIMLVFLALYAVLRFVLEYFRADDRGALLGLSTSQLIGVGMLGLTAYLWMRWSSPTAVVQATAAAADPDADPDPDPAADSESAKSEEE